MFASKFGFFHTYCMNYLYTLSCIHIYSYIIFSVNFTLTHCIYISVCTRETGEAAASSARNFCFCQILYKWLNGDGDFFNYTTEISSEKTASYQDLN